MMSFRRRVQKNRSNHGTRLAMESLEARDVPATDLIGFADTTVILNGTSMFVANPNSPGATYPLSAGDQFSFFGTNDNDQLQFVVNSFPVVPITISINGLGGTDLVSFPGFGDRISFDLNPTSGGAWTGSAQRIVSAPSDPFPSLDPNLEFAFEGVEKITGTNQADIFNINGVIAADLSTGPVNSGAVDSFVFADGARLVAGNGAAGTITTNEAVELDFASYLSGLTIDLSNGQAAVTNGAGDSMTATPVAKVARVIGSSAADTFSFSGFGLAPDGPDGRDLALVGEQGDDTFVLVNAPTGAVSTINFSVSGSDQTTSGSPGPNALGDSFRIDRTGASNVFDLSFFDRESTVPAFPGMLTSTGTTIIDVPFVGIESFIGGAGNDQFISTFSRMGSTGYFFDGRGGSDIYATRNQVADLIAADASDFLLGVDLTQDVVQSNGSVALPLYVPRRTGNTQDLFFTQQKRSIADNDRLITVENQRSVYAAFVAFLSDRLGVLPTSADRQLWVTQIIEGRQLSSLDVAREFVLGDLDSNGTRDFYLSFFSGNFISVAVADPQGAAQQAASGPGLKATSISLGIVLSNADFVDRSIERLFGGPASIPESTQSLRLRAINVLNNGGSWEDALVTLINSEEFLRQSVRSAAEVSDLFADIVPPLPKSSIVKTAVPLLSVFRDGQWKADADQLSLTARFEQLIQFGVPGDRPVLGDWNGDGLPDLGVYRDGVWFLDTNGILGWQGDDTAVSFGVQIDRPVVGDWNGDGADDLGVYRNGVWFLDTNGTRGWQGNDSSASFGVPQDIPIAADWNGDGKSDLGVIRQGSRFFADSNGTLGWQGDDTDKVLSKAILQPVGGDFDLNSFGDVTQFGQAGTELAAVSVFSGASPSSAIQIQASIAPGERGVAWARGGRPLSPPASQYTLLASQQGSASRVSSSSLLSSIGLAMTLPTTPKTNSTLPVQEQAIDNVFETDIWSLDES